MKRAAHLVLAVGVACGESGVVGASCVADPESYPRTIERQLSSNLTQILTISSGAVEPGFDLHIVSRIRNTGSSQADVRTLLCDLEYGGSLRVSPRPFGCEGRAEGPAHLAPGDEVRNDGLLKIESAAGEYVLQVKHLVSPALWGEFPIRVRASSAACDDLG